MATTYTNNLRLGMPATSDRQWDVTLNANAVLLDGVAAIGGLAPTTLEVPSASLNCQVAAGTYLKSNGAPASFAGASPVVLPANATSFVWLTDAGVVGVGASYPAPPYLPIASVTTGPSSITQLVDTRAAYQSAGATTAFVSRNGDTVGGALQVANPSTGAATLSVDPVNLLVGFFGTPPATQAAKVAPLTDSTTGTAGPTLANVGTSFSQATLNNNFASLAAEVNALVAALKWHGLMSS